MYCEIYPEISDRHPITSEQWQEWFAIWEKYLLSANLLSAKAQEYELSLAVTNDVTMQQLNLQYRQQDRPTDVLSFAALESEMPEIPKGMSDYIEPTYLGDIIISQTTAISQAQERDHSLTYELAWLAAHGFLHLLGWDHPDDQSLEAMLAEQDIMLNLISLE